MREKIIKKKCEKKHFKWDDELKNIKFLEFCKIVIRTWTPTQYFFLRIRIFGLKFVWSVFNDWFFFQKSYEWEIHRLIYIFFNMQIIDSFQNVRV